MTTTSGRLASSAGRAAAASVSPSELVRAPRRIDGSHLARMTARPPMDVLPALTAPVAPARIATTDPLATAMRRATGDPSEPLHVLSRQNRVHPRLGPGLDP